MEHRHVLSAQYYQDEGKKLRDLLESEADERRRKTLTRIARSYEELSKQLFMESRARTGG